MKAQNIKRRGGREERWVLPEGLHMGKGQGPKEKNKAINNMLSTRFSMPESPGICHSTWASFAVPIMEGGDG